MASKRRQLATGLLAIGLYLLQSGRSQDGSLGMVARWPYGGHIARWPEGFMGEWREMAQGEGNWELWLSRFA